MTPHFSFILNSKFFMPISLRIREILANKICSSMRTEPASSRLRHSKNIHRENVFFGGGRTSILLASAFKKYSQRKCVLWWGPNLHSPGLRIQEIFAEKMCLSVGTEPASSFVIGKSTFLLACFKSRP